MKPKIVLIGKNNHETILFMSDGSEINIGYWDYVNYKNNTLLCWNRKHTAIYNKHGELINEIKI